MNTCKECNYYSGDQDKGLCHVVPPKINLAIVGDDWTEDSLINACIRPVVSSDDRGCGLFKRASDEISYIYESQTSRGMFD